MCFFSLRNIHYRNLKSSCLTAFGLFLATSVTIVSADTLDVYCVPSVDGVSTCSGWKNGETLTCVSSSGGVASCKSSSEQDIICTQSSAGITTCQDPQSTTGASSENEDCSFIGNGSFICDKKQKTSSDLIPSPINTDDVTETPDRNLNLSIPSLIP